MNIRLPLLGLLGGIIVLILIEVAFRSGTSIKEIKATGKYDLIAGFRIDSECNPFERVYPHPHFAYTVTKDDRCEDIAKSNFRVGTEDYYKILFLGADLAMKIATNVEAELNKSFHSPTGKPFRVLSQAAPGLKQPVQTFVLNQRAQKINAVVSVEGMREVETILEGRKLDAPPALYYFVTRSKDYDGASHRDLLKLKRSIDANVILRNSSIALRFFLWKKRNFEETFEREFRSSLLYRSFNYPESWTSELRVKAGVTRYVDLIEAMTSISNLWGLKSALFFEDQGKSEEAVIVFEKIKDELRLRRSKIPWIVLSHEGRSEVIAELLVQKLSLSWRLEKK